MATIKHKRGLESALVTLSEAEFGFTTDQKNIYIGSSTGNIKIAKYSDVSSLSGTLSTHTTNTTIHITSTERTNWNAKYVKPSTGIPATDLASAVQTSLGKADTAIQAIPSATSSVLGGVKVGTNISVSSGVISVADGTTSAKGLVQLSSATNSTSTALAATASAVKAAYDLANGKYSKPSTGIPKTDLASDVQASLTKADSAEANAKSYTNTKIAELVGSAPEALNTLEELATAIKENETAFDGLLEVIGSKADSGDISGHAANTTIHITSTERTTWNAKYTKPSTGILKADLASTVQTSLGKADTALQATSSLDATKLTGVAAVSTSGNAGTATKLATARTISLSGGVTGSAAFDGSSNITITTTVAGHSHAISEVSGLQAALDAKAPLASPGFSGTPTAPTAAAGTNTTQLATTAFVTAAVSGKTTITGNAGSATKLATARTINGVSFDGTANITIADSTKLPVGGTAAAATKLVTSRTIDGISFDGTAAVSSYGTSSTDAATAAKVATVSSTLSLVAGARVAIKFTTANSAASPTLNVNSLGAKPIWFRGAALTSSLYYWAANQVVEFVYDGTNWNMTGAPNNQNNTYSTLKNPYAISINGTSYDGSAAVSITGLATQTWVQQQIATLRDEIIAALVGTTT